MKVHGTLKRLESSSIHGVLMMSEASEGLGDLGFWLSQEEITGDEIAHLEIELEKKWVDLQGKKVQ